MTNRWRRFVWLSIGIDYQYQSIDKLVSIGCRLAETELTHKKSTLYAVIVNTIHFNVNRRTISLFSLKRQRPVHGNPVYFWQIKSLFHGPIFLLQKTESGCIGLWQKNSGNRSCTFANNETANNSSMSCCKIMKKAAITSLVITNLIVLKTKTFTSKRQRW